MSLRLLIDECLTPDLVNLAVPAGHVESSCLRDRGLLGTQDWTLMKHVLAEDFTLVTAQRISRLVYLIELEHDALGLIGPGARPTCGTSPAVPVDEVLERMMSIRSISPDAT